MGGRLAKSQEPQDAPPNNEETTSSEDVKTNPIINEYSSQEIRDINDHVQNIKEKHSAILSTPYIPDMKEQLEQENIEVLRCAVIAVQNLLEMHKSIADEENSNQGNDSDIRMKKRQHSTLSKEIVYVMTEYKQIQDEYRDRRKNRIKRQLQITDSEKSYTDEEIEEMIDSDGSRIFTNGMILTETQQQALKEIENKHKDDIKSEMRNEIEVIQKDIRNIQKIIQNIKESHGRMLSAPLSTSDTKERLEHEKNEVTRCANRVIQKLIEMQNTITDEENQRNSADTEIKKNQHVAVSREFLDTMVEYYKTQNEYRDRCKNRIKRQFEITNRRCTDEEIEEVMDNDNPSVFTEGIVTETQRAKQALKEIEAKQNDIINSENSKEIEVIQQDILDIRKLNQNIKERHRRILSTPDPGDTKEKLEQENDEVTRCANRVVQNLIEMQKTRTGEENSTQGDSSVNRKKKSQHSALSREFVRVMAGYKKNQNEYRDKRKNRIKGLLQLTNNAHAPEKKRTFLWRNHKSHSTKTLREKSFTDEDIEKMIDNDGPGNFTTGVNFISSISKISTETQQAEQALNEIENKHNDDIKSEMRYEIELIQKYIHDIQELIQNIKKRHNEILSAPYLTSGVKEELVHTENEVTRCANRVVQNLKEMQKIITDEENHRNYNDIKIKKNQQAAVSREFVDSMIEYYTAQNDYRDRCKTKIRRQLEITGKSYTDEEIEEMVDSKSPDFFTKGLL